MVKVIDKNSRPIVSFLMLSYNNAPYVREAIDSILSQTVDDFEIVFLDDASTDNSVDIVRSYSDERIRIFRHDKNQGLTPSYNEAVSLCRGDFISNLDSDDCIEPTKTEKQLGVFRDGQNIEVVGTYVKVIDENSAPHRQGHLTEAIINTTQDFNSISNWIGKNNLPRSSTMMAKSLHQRVGPNEIGMVRAPDYDLWVRGLAAGARFHSIDEPLTRYRQHSKGLTYGDPKATYLELSYSFIKYLVPLIERRSDYQSFTEGMSWMIESALFAELASFERHRLAAIPFSDIQLGSFQTFIELLQDPVAGQLEALGKKVIAQHLLHPSIAKSDGLIGGIEWSNQQILNWRNLYDNAVLLNSREAEWSKQQIENWKSAYDNAELVVKSLEAERSINLESLQRQQQQGRFAPWRRIWKR